VDAGNDLEPLPWVGVALLIDIQIRSVREDDLGFNQHLVG
jgi:hypothetical protein